MAHFAHDIWNERIIALSAALLLEEEDLPREDADTSSSATQRTCWVRPFLQERDEKGEFAILMKDLQQKDPKFFRLYLRMEVSTFSELLDILRPHLTYETTNMREPIAPEQRLAVILLFLGHGHEMTTLSIPYRLGVSTVHKIVTAGLKAIKGGMMDSFLGQPTLDTLKACEDGFHNRWDFPNCCGAVDGKHVKIQAPGHSGSAFYCYKGYFSVNLMAVVGPDYKFIMIDVGNYGSQADSAIFKNSSFGKEIIEQRFPFPPPKEIGDGKGPLPHVIVGDEAFPLCVNLLRPYSRAALTGSTAHAKRVFNYRLSRARRVSENAFGILANVFRIFHGTVHLREESMEDLLYATCILHNFLRDREGAILGSSSFCPVGLHAPLLSLPPSFNPLNTDGRGRPRRDAPAVRDRFMEFFNSPAGSRPWQDQVVHRGGY